MISPDLTLNDQSRQQRSGGLTPDNVGVEYAGVVFAIAESSREKGVIWAGTNDGQLQVTRDAGGRWTNVTANIPGLPPWGTVSNIEPSRFDNGAAYVTFDLHQVNNRDPFVFKTTDYGRTWRSVAGDIPKSVHSYAHCVREDPIKRGLLYLGTENALYVSPDDGQHWLPLQSGLPHAPVHWLTIQEHFNDLVVATYGRGFYILDDITPLRTLTPDALNEAAHLFPPRPTYRFRTITDPMTMPDDPTEGRNAPYGAAITFSLRSHATGRGARRDQAGDQRCSGQGRQDDGGGQGGTRRRQPCLVGSADRSTVRRSRSEPVRNTPPTFESDRTARASSRPVGRSRFSCRRAPTRSSWSPAGSSGSSRSSFARIPTPPAPTRTSRRRPGCCCRSATTSTLPPRRLTMPSLVRAQLTALRGVIGDGEAQKVVLKAAADLDAKIAEIESRLFNMTSTGRGQDMLRTPSQMVEKLSHLADVVSYSDFAPTESQLEVGAALTQQLAHDQEQIAGVLAKDVALFNAMLRERQMGAVVMPPR